MNLLSLFRRPVAPVAAPLPDATLAVINAYHTEAAATLERLKKQGALAQAYSTNDPYRYQTPQDPRFRPYSALSTDMLRLLGHSCDIPARCIAHLKSEVTKVPVKIVEKDGDGKSSAAAKDVEKMNQFFSQRGGLGGYGTDRATFEARLIEDLLIIGAATPWFQGDTIGDLKTGKYVSIEHVNSATIRPLVTAYVRTPSAGEPAFEQWIMGSVMGTFYHDEMIYKGLPSGARSDSPYFYSCTEQAAFQIFTVQKIDEWNREFLVNGNGHRRWVDTSSLTPESAQAWLEIMKAQTTGNAAQRQGIGLAPGPLTGEESRKDQDFEKFEDGRIERICAAYGVNPASIGFTSQMYKQAQGDAMSSTSEGMVTELLMWRESLYNQILERMGYDHLVVTEDISEPSEEPQARVARQSQQISGGIKTVNEVRAENGDESIDGGEKLLVASSLVPLDKAGEDPPMPPGFGGGGKDTPPGGGKPVAGTPDGKDGVARGDWVEALHPRETDGKFGTTEHGQNRARPGGERGANAEWYEGGKFIATKDNPKKMRDAVKKTIGTGKEEVAPYDWRVLPPGEMPLITPKAKYYLAWPDSTRVQEGVKYSDGKPLTDSDRAEILDIGARYANGERTRKVSESPKDATPMHIAKLMDSPDTAHHEVASAALHAKAIDADRNSYAVGLLSKALGFDVVQWHKDASKGTPDGKGGGERGDLERARGWETQPRDEPIERMSKAAQAGGRWVTIEGRHVFLKDSEINEDHVFAAGVKHELSDEGHNQLDDAFKTGNIQNARHLHHTLSSAKKLMDGGTSEHDALRWSLEKHGWLNDHEDEIDAYESKMNREVDKDVADANRTAREKFLGTGQDIVDYVSDNADTRDSAEALAKQLGYRSATWDDQKNNKRRETAKKKSRAFGASKTRHANLVATQRSEIESDPTADLALWQKKALARVADGRSAACRFESVAIPSELNAEIFARLEACETREDVRAVFRVVADEIEGDESPGDGGLERGFWESLKHPRGQSGKFTQSEADAKRAIAGLLGRALGGVESGKAGEFAQSFALILDSMTPTSITHLSSNVSRVAIYGTPQELRDGVGDPAAPKEPLGCYEASGALHIDCGNAPIRWKTFSAAHEMAHAIDGPQKTFSGSTAWRDAWQKELSSGELTPGAAFDPSEGFAEFGRIVFSGTKQDIAKHPKCAAFWRDGGLL